MIWIFDAYTTSDRFPYGQSANPNAVREGDLRDDFNYIRNSIKVTVDAYNGSVEFHVIDEEDPLARSYRRMFPALFADEPPSDELRAHFRYPEDLFRVQTEMWGRYRISDPSEFYDAAGAWSVAQDPGNSIGQVDRTTVTDAQGNIISDSEVRISPQYLLMRLPGDSEESFLIFRPFVPFSEDDSRKDLEAFMVVHNDPENYGKMEVFEVRSNTQIDGPALFNSNIQTEEEISQRITLLNQNGSTVKPGNLLLIPIENSLLYVRPLFIEATGSTPVPELQLVIVGVGPTVVIDETFEDALERAIPDLDVDLDVAESINGDAAPDPPDDGATPDDGGTETPDDDGADPPTTTEPARPDPGDDASLIELIEAARDAFDDADAALRRGDLAAYEEAIERAEEFVRRAEENFPPEADPPTTTTIPPPTTEAASA